MAVRVERIAKAIAKSQRVGKFQGVNRSGLSGGCRFRVEGGEHIFAKFMASELG